MYRRSFIPLCLIAMPALALYAEDAAPAEVPPEPPRWATTGKAGAFVSNVVTGNNDTSRDPAISGSNDTLAYRLALEAGLDFRADKHSVDQRLLAKFGRKKDENIAWIDDTDEVRYDGVYRYQFHQPHFGYASWGWESVFTGPDPDNDLFSPGLLKSAVGYGQLYEDFWSQKSKAEARIGAAVRKRYGNSLTDADRETETGLEIFARLEHQRDDSLRYFVQYEGFAEFKDVGHIINVFTAGLTASLNKYLSLEMGLRAFYESRPDSVTQTPDDGYGEWSMRQDTLIGLAYTW